MDLFLLVLFFALFGIFVGVITESLIIARLSVGAILITFLIIVSNHNYSVSSNETLGYITKVSTVGMFFKTDEMELSVLGIVNGSGSFSKRISLTIKDRHVYDFAKLSLTKRIPVKVKYHQELSAPFQSGSLACFVDYIECMN